MEQQRDLQRRQDEEAAGLQEQNRQRAFELREPIWGRIRDAAHVSDGAITVDRNGRAALTTFHLWWQEGQPDRALRIVVDETEGRVQASWVVAPGYGHSVDAPSVEACRFDMSTLEAVIQLLADQRRWACGVVPMIPW